jgi:hypothetical protein
MKEKISKLMFRKFVDIPHQLPEYNPTADFQWVMTQSGLPWLRLNILVPYQTILEEIANIESLLVAHRETYGEHQGWKSFCIHGKSYDATQADEYYKDNRCHTWTIEAKQFMPQTVEYFSHSWPALEFQRIRVMLLEPGGYINVHSDSAASRLAPVNIAITQPADCKFVMQNHGTVPFRPGQVFWLNVSNLHTVFNDSELPRWHIIVHQKFDKNFQNIAVDSYKMLYNR